MPRSARVPRGRTRHRRARRAPPTRALDARGARHVPRRVPALAAFRRRARRSSFSRWPAVAVSSSTWPPARFSSASPCRHARAHLRAARRDRMAGLASARSWSPGSSQSGACARRSSDRAAPAAGGARCRARATHDRPPRHGSRRRDRSAPKPAAVRAPRPRDPRGARAEPRTGGRARRRRRRARGRRRRPVLRHRVGRDPGRAGRRDRRRARPGRGLRRDRPAPRCPAHRFVHRKRRQARSSPSTSRRSSPRSLTTGRPRGGGAAERSQTGRLVAPALGQLSEAAA